MDDHRPLTPEQFGCPPNGRSFVESHRQRLSFRNERTLYNRTCDATGEPMISIYAPDSPLTVYKSEAWHGDSWDPLSFGREFDFSRPFFDQFSDWWKPHTHLTVQKPCTARSAIAQTVCSTQ